MKEKFKELLVKPTLFKHTTYDGALIETLRDTEMIVYYKSVKIKCNIYLYVYCMFFTVKKNVQASSGNVTLRGHRFTVSHNTEITHSWPRISYSHKIFAVLT